MNDHDHQPEMREERYAEDVIGLLLARSSIRNFKTTAVPEELLHRLLDAARRAPTSSNVQACSLVVVRDAETKRQLAVLAGNQRHVAETPVFVAVCADLSRMETACARHGTTLAGQNLEMSMVAVVDAALVGMSLSLAVDSCGLGSVMIGGMRNEPVAVAKLLGLPPHAFAVFGMCLGWPAEPKQPKPRFPENAVIHFERYDTAARDAGLPAYDAALEDHYRAMGKATDKASWTQRVARVFSSVRRPDLRRHLEALGFGFH